MRVFKSFNVFAFIMVLIVSVMGCQSKKTTITKDVSALSNNETIEKKGIIVSEAMIYTNLGNMKVGLYKETPKHTANFIKLAHEKYYDGLLFHRIIKNFMIQGGDPDSRNASANKELGNGGPDYEINPEFVQGIYHKKGALAAARLGDDENPEKKSSGSQFYIVQGRTFSSEQLNKLSAKMGKTFSPQQISTYSTVGGTPHLDGDYTIFGEVIEGLEILDKIAIVQTGNLDRPVKDVVIDSVRVIKE